MGPESFGCPIQNCGRSTLTLRDLIGHMRCNHRFDTVQFTCNIDCCPLQFQSWETFRRHVTRSHYLRWNEVRSRGSNIASALGSTGQNALPGNIVEGDASTSQLHSAESNTEFQGSSSHCQEMYSDLIAWVSKEYILLKLRLEHTYGLTKIAKSGVMSCVSDMLKTFKCKIDSCVLTKLNDLGLKDDFLSFILNDETSLNEALINMPQSVEDKLLKEMGYVPPKQVYLDEADCNRPQDKDQTEQTVDDIVLDGENSKSRLKNFVHYVPIADTIRNYLSHEDVFESVMRETIHDGKLDKFCGGTIMSEVPLLHSDKRALRIMLYTDEFEVCNPIGAHTKKHKICGVYFSLGNIESQYGSSLKSIHLVMLAKYPLIQKYGYNVVFRCIVEDLKRLEGEGLSIGINGKEYKFNVVLAAVLGDNLSSHAIGGFRAVFTSGRVCRHCMVLRKDLSSIHHENQCTLRTKEGHDAQVASVGFDPSLVSVYGVKNKSVFSELESYHPVLSHSPDMMHDVFEGLLPWNITIVVKGLVKSGVLSLSAISDNLKLFKYGQNDCTNVFSGLPANFMSSKASSLPGTAAEKLHLFRMFSLIFGPHVPEGNLYWQLHLICNEICDILLCPEVLDDWLPTLALRISEHHQLWIQLPENITGSFKPKIHYLVHYPRLMARFGPLRHISCMRYEAFHLFFKKCVRVSNNFINVTSTAATKFQKKRCLEYAGTSALPTTSVKGAQQTQKLQSLPAEERDVVSKYLNVGSAILLKVKSLYFEGQSFKVSDYVILEVSDDEIPLFYHIMHIYCHENIWFFSGRLVFVHHWDPHLHAYEVTISDDVENRACVIPAQLIALQNLDLYNIQNKRFIKLRHKPVAKLLQ